MITPTVIQEKEFTKGVRGYKEDEVDQFLDQITLDLGTLLQENRGLKERIAELNAAIDRYRGTEGMLFDTLESAKAMMTDISTSSEKRAEIVLKNAELEAERIQREARESVEKMTEDAVEMARRWDHFKTRYRNLLQTELDRFDTLSTEIIVDPADRSGFYSDFEPSTPSAPATSAPIAPPVSNTVRPQRNSGPIQGETFKNPIRNK